MVIWNCSRQPRNMTETWDVRCTGFHRACNFRCERRNSMIQVKPLVYVLSLIGIAAIMGYSSKTASEYVPPSEAVSRGRAPGMQVQMLSRGDETREYAVIFGKGDEAFSGILDFAEKYHITSAHFTAIGALNGATLAWFDPQRKMYKTIPVEGQVEVI